MPSAYTLHCLQLTVTGAYPGRAAEVAVKYKVIYICSQREIVETEHSRTRFFFLAALDFEG